MNIRDVKRVLPILLKHKIAPFLWGSQGIGKTQTVGQYTKENDLQLITLYTATQEVGDLIGLLVKDDKNKTAYHTRPEWFPTSGKGIIFLDELNRAPTEVIQAMFSFILNGTLHTHKLPEGWSVVAAGNYNSDRFTVTDTSDSAWLSRFCHIDFTPSVEEWLMYAEDNGANTVASFIREQPSMLELSQKEGGRLDTSFIVPDRRSWLNIGKHLENDPDMPEELRYEIYSGIVGVAPAAAYMSWKNNRKDVLSLSDVLNDYKNKRKLVKESSSDPSGVRFDMLNQPVDELIERLKSDKDFLKDDKKMENLKQFLLDIPRELAMKAFSLFESIRFNRRDELINDKDYVSKFM